MLEYDWTWGQIPYWVHAEWARHKFEKFISSQRDDRNPDEPPRGKKPQDAPVIFDGYANHQNLIDAWRKRLCFMATKEARALAVDFKFAMAEVGLFYESYTLVPNCVYRCGCPEPNSTCGFFNRFRMYAQENGVDIFDIKQRYKCYDKLLREMEHFDD